MSTTKTLQERLRAEAWRANHAIGPDDGASTDFLFEAADALDAKDALLREAREVLPKLLKYAGAYESEHMSNVALDIVQEARALLLKLTEATK